MSATELVQLDNFSNIFSLRAKVAVVTGGSRGLGLHAASGYARLVQSESGDSANKGNSFIQSGCAKVYLIARTESDVKAAADALNNLSAPGKEPNAQAIPIVGDISKPGECERVAAEVAKTTDHVDILLANAGATYIAPFDDYNEDEFARVMHVNVNSVFFSIQKFTPLLAAGGTVGDPSRVLMVSSVAGVVIGDVGPYGSSSFSPTDFVE
jgi:NAD(P)-dependent dehydrogenase (short-subunit alcohol dehydrogenase family)